MHLLFTNTQEVRVFRVLEDGGEIQPLFIPLS